jgi:hypothetical protein
MLLQEEVQAIIMAKWRKYGHLYFTVSTGMAFTFASSLTCAVIVTNHSTLGYTLSYVLSALVLLAMFAEEALVIYHTGPSTYFHYRSQPTGAALFRRVCLWFMVCLTIIGCVTGVAKYKGELPTKRSGVIAQLTSSPTSVELFPSAYPTYIPTSMPIAEVGSQNDAQIFVFSMSLLVSWFYMFYFMMGYEV